MKDIIVKSQKEFDELDETIKNCVIRIEFGSTDNRALLNRSFTRCVFHVENKYVEVRNTNTRVRVFGDSNIVAYGTVHITAFDNTLVELHDNTFAFVNDNVHVVAFENSCVKCSFGDGIEIDAYDTSTIESISPISKPKICILSFDVKCIVHEYYKGEITGLKGKIEKVKFVTKTERK